MNWSEARTGERMRSAGWTLPEVAVCVALIGVVLGTLATTYPALTEATVETRLFLLAQIENDKARLKLSEDLQMTDTTQVDAQGVPYFKIINDGDGFANAIVFRRAEGFEILVDEDIVKTRYSTPIKYHVDPTGNLLRTQDNVGRLVGQKFREIRFHKTPEGAVTVRLTTFYMQDGEEHEVTSEMQIVPRNVLKT